MSVCVCIYFWAHSLTPIHTHTHTDTIEHPHNQVACGKMRVHCTEVVRKKTKKKGKPREK